MAVVPPEPAIQHLAGMGRIGSQLEQLERDNQTAAELRAGLFG